jgi:hypothetical protein
LGVPIGDDAVNALAGMSSLRWVLFDKDQCAEDVLLRLSKALPKAEIRVIGGGCYRAGEHRNKGCGSILHDNMLL